jgi:hypothetical protein
MGTGINFVAVLISAIVSMIIGWVWYGPLFGKKFKDAMGWSNHSPEEVARMKKSMTKSYVLQFIGSLVMFFVMSWYVNTSVNRGIVGALGNAFGLWLGFVVPLSLSNTLWGGKWSLFWMNIGCMLVTFLAAGVIMGAL